MAIYYVRTGGNDGLSGLDDANAWATVSKANGTPIAGDTVRFRRGDTFGTTGLNPKSSVTFEAYGSGALPKFTVGSDLSGGRSNMIFRNLWIETTGVAFKSTTTDTAGNSVTGVRVYGCTIGGSAATKCSVPVYVRKGPIEGSLNDDSDWIFDGCTFQYANDSGAIVCGTSTKIRNTTIWNTGYVDPGSDIHGIYFKCRGRSATDYAEVSNCTIYNHSIARDGQGISIRGKWARVFKNRVSKGTGIGTEGISFYTQDPVDGGVTYIYDNEITGYGMGTYLDGNVNAPFGGGGIGNPDIVIYGNTYADTGVCIDSNNYDNRNAAVVIRNNIFKRSAGEIIRLGNPTAGSTLTMDANTYWPSGSGGSYYSFDGASHTFAAFIVHTGETTSAERDPKLIGTWPNIQLDPTSSEIGAASLTCDLSIAVAHGPGTGWYPAVGVEPFQYQGAAPDRGWVEFVEGVATLVDAGTVTILVDGSGVESGSSPGPTAWYFAQAGNDTTGDGSQAKPFKTIAKANATGAAGDTVYFRRGDTWSEAVSFTPQNAITYRAYDVGADPIVKPTGALQPCFFTGDASFVTLIGLVFDSSMTDAQPLLSTSSQTAGSSVNVTIDACTFRNSNGGVVVGKGPLMDTWDPVAAVDDANWTITNCLYDNLGDSGQIHLGSGLTFAFNTIRNCGWNAALLYGKHGIYAKCRSATIHDNDISNVSQDAVYGGQPISLRAKGAVVYRNRCHALATANTEGISYYPDDPVAGGVVAIYANWITGCSGAGIYLGVAAAAALPSFAIYNNTLDLDCTTGIDVAEAFDRGVNVYLRNNIVKTPGPGALVKSKVFTSGSYTETNSLFWPGGQGLVAYSWAGSGVTLAAYKVASGQGAGSTEDNPFLDAAGLISSTLSAAIDHGTTTTELGVGTWTVGTDGAVFHYSGAAPDAGWMETILVSTPPVVVPPVVESGTGIVTVKPVLGGTLGCGTYVVQIRTRGGKQLVAELPYESGSWERTLNETSGASVKIAGLRGANAACCGVLAKLRPWLHEVAILRDGVMVWAGPVAGGPVEFGTETASIPARDLSAWLERRFIHDALSFKATDLASIFAAIVTSAMRVDTSPGLAVSASKTGVTGERVYRVQDYVIAGTELRELANTGIDWVMIGREMRAGGIVVPTTPITRLDDASFASPPTVSLIGSDQANTWVVTGSQPRDVTTGQFVDGDKVSGRAAASVAATRDGVLEQRVQEDSILDAASAAAAARSRLALTSEPVVVISGGVLAPSATLTIDRLVPGALVTASIRGTCVPAVGTYRLQSVNVEFGGGGEAVTIALQPIGATP